jgi:hypothetical protein
LADLVGGYLAGLVSGQIDADKLDYMTRDSYFTGLPIGLTSSDLSANLKLSLFCRSVRQIPIFESEPNPPE